MKRLTDRLNQFQVLIATILSILATVGIDKVGILKTLQNPFEWTAWQALFFGVVALIIGIAVVSFALHFLFSPWLLLVAVAVFAWIKLRPRGSRQ